MVKNIAVIKLVEDPQVVDPDFMEDWMAENDLQVGSEWEKLKSGYEKEFCEVRLKDGRIEGPCYPNAGKFTRLDGVCVFTESEITHIRYFENKNHGGDEIEPLGGEED